MGVKVQYNPSTGKVSFNPATGKVQVVAQNFSSEDHCCFLNPNAPLWNIGVTYSKDDEVSWSPIPGFVFRSLVDSNTGNAPNDTNFWLQSSVAECGNTGWNSYPTFGGVGKTPLFYSVEISNAVAVPFITCGISIPSKLNTLHTLTAVIGVPHTWEGEIPNATTLNNCSLFIKLSLGNVDTPASGLLEMGQPGEFSYFIVLSACDIAGSGTGTNADFEWNPK